MNRIVEKGKTLMVDGPASVTVLSGKVEVFGFLIDRVRKIVIREGKRLPFEVQETATFHLELGAKADVHEVTGTTIPASWGEAYETTRQFRKKPVVIVVIGGVDTGKSSFCTYLINRLVRDKCTVAILDEDLGQSDIGPPGTVGYSYVANPVTDLFGLKPENIAFIGSTSPNKTTDRIVEASVSLKNEILSETTTDFVVVNTDGWVIGEEAVQFKSRLATALASDVAFCIENRDLIPSLSATFGDTLANLRQERVDSPVEIRERDKESRRSLRELGFAKYLENARVRVFPLNHITVEGKENYALIWRRETDNLLVGFYDMQKRFLGIGILRSTDSNRRALKILTAVAKKPTSVAFGKVRLDRNLREYPGKASD